jgi:hypothetical protein
MTRENMIDLLVWRVAPVTQRLQRESTYGHMTYSHNPQIRHMPTRQSGQNKTPSANWRTDGK